MLSLFFPEYNVKIFTGHEDIKPQSDFYTQIRSHPLQNFSLHFSLVHKLIGLSLNDNGLLSNKQW